MLLSVIEIIYNKVKAEYIETAANDCTDSLRGNALVIFKRFFFT